MYGAIILVLIIITAGLVYLGISQKKKAGIVSGVLLGLFTLTLFSILDFWGEYLWFDSLGYTDRFWTAIGARIVMALIGAAVGFTIPFVLNVFYRGNKLIKIIGCLLAAWIGAQWGYMNWDTILLYLNQAPSSVSDPIFGKSVSFYLFSLPLYHSIQNFLMLLVMLSLILMVLSRFLSIQLDYSEMKINKIDLQKTFQLRDFQSLFLNVGAVFLLLAAGRYLQRFMLLYSELGVVQGVGWTDDRVVIPANTLLAVLTAIFALILFFTPASWVIRKISDRFNIPTIAAPFAYIGSMAVVTALVWFIGLAVLPGLLQWLRVEPNEITFERPYIANNIEFTRQGFKLDGVEEKQFPAKEELTSQMFENNRTMIENIRLWDWRALDSVYKQFQEIRLYYEFTDVDIDRYTIDDRYRQTMVSAREMQINNLPSQSQTFVNKRFKYTHGYGMTMATVTDFTPEGLPNLLVKDIPPKSKYESLAVEVPQIYYGELTNDHVIVNSEEAEFDFPAGEENQYNRYKGKGGVLIENLWRKFIFGWKFDGTRLFLSSYPTPESRILFHRNIMDRVRTLAPFLKFDDDPYMVLAEGKIYWIIDAYTTSRNYPYSEQIRFAGLYRSSRRTVNAKDAPGQLNGVNYIRNSVKVVVDAYEGTVDFYIFDARDVLIQTWNQVFEGMFRPGEQMPASLRSHIRYPSDFLLIQGLMYAKYHMTDPTVFYNQEDLWVRATEKYYDNVQPVQPYYIIWEPPGTDHPEFVLMMPFTPKNRQVLISWIAGMCDGDNYGRFLAYKFPKEKRVLGTQQMETKIDQDSFLSGQLSLWDQRGSNVIRGNVLVIPIEETIFYVEPIYLQAETAAYPELRLVAVMHNDKLSYAETFDEALEGLLSPGQQKKPTPAMPVSDFDIQTLVERANAAFEEYLKATGEKDFDRASNQLSSLQKYLQQLMESSKQTPEPQE